MSPFVFINTGDTFRDNERYEEYKAHNTNIKKQVAQIEIRPLSRDAAKRVLYSIDLCWPAIVH